MNQILLQKGVKDQKIPHAIKITIVVNLQKINCDVQRSIDPEIPFNIFINGIKEQICSQKMLSWYDDELEFQLSNGSRICQYNSTLHNLGFKNNCSLYINQKSDGYKKTDNKKLNKRTYKGLVELKNRTIQLFVDQLKTTPVSCVFHDILVELFKNYQIDIALSFVFFINGTEVQPFELRSIQDFLTNEGIIIKLVVPKKQPNEDSIEKYQFALNKSRSIKRCQKKIITIELIDKMQFFDYTDISLEEMFEKIQEDLQFYNSSVQYQINNKISFGLSNIYALNDFKFTIVNQNDFGGNCFKIVGDFYKKVKINGSIDGNYYFIEETIPINTSMIEFLKDFKFKLFGPKQHNYTQEIIEEEDNLVRINYLMNNK